MSAGSSNINTYEYMRQVRPATATVVANKGVMCFSQLPMHSVGDSNQTRESLIEAAMCCLSETTSAGTQ